MNSRRCMISSFEVRTYSTTTPRTLKVANSTDRIRSRRLEAIMCLRNILLSKRVVEKGGHRVTSIRLRGHLVKRPGNRGGDRRRRFFRRRRRRSARKRQNGTSAMLTWDRELSLKRQRPKTIDEAGIGPGGSATGPPTKAKGYRGASNPLISMVTAHGLEQLSR
jgi:hypothetical protein